MQIAFNQITIDVNSNEKIETKRIVNLIILVKNIQSLKKNQKEEIK